MKYVVGYDESNVAKDAMKLTFDRAKNHNATVDVIRTVQQSHQLKYEEIRRHEQALENDAKAACGDNGVEYKTHLLVTQQTSGEAIVEFAKDHGVDEIIIGIRRRSKVEKLVFGSTAQYIILNAPCPVLSIR
ncbi:MAG: universal stress protein [Proteobacteria bacterium]|nr:universal stress protein [Pseudomonadota bacterium]